MLRFARKTCIYGLNVEIWSAIYSIKKKDFFGSLRLNYIVVNWGHRKKIEKLIVHQIESDRKIFCFSIFLLSYRKTANYQIILAYSTVGGVSRRWSLEPLYATFDSSLSWAFFLQCNNKYIIDCEGLHVMFCERKILVFIVYLIELRENVTCHHSYPSRTVPTDHFSRSPVAGPLMRYSTKKQQWGSQHRRIQDNLFHLADQRTKFAGE